MRKIVLLLAAMATALVLVSGVALAVTKIGGPGDDVLRGTDKPDYLFGNAGDDVIYGRGGDDAEISFSEASGALVGGKGDDKIYGGAGDDDLFAGGFYPGLDQPYYQDKNILYGGKGSDAVLGDAGPDVLYGNAGPDWMFGDFDNPDGRSDTIYGGRGNDFISSGHSVADKDRVFCGPGTDEVRADRKDFVAGDCERVFRF